MPFGTLRYARRQTASCSRSPLPISAVRVHVEVTKRCRVGQSSSRDRGPVRLTAVAARRNTASRCELPGGACDVGGDDIGRMPVQAAAGPVVPNCGSRVGVGGGLLDVAQRHAGVQGGGDECVPQRVRPDGLGDPGAARDLADDPPGALPVQPPPSAVRKTGPSQRSPGGQVDRPGGARRQRDRDDLAALAGDGQGPAAALQPQVLDVSAGSLRTPSARSARAARSAHALAAGQVRRPPAGRRASCGPGRWHGTRNPAAAVVRGRPGNGQECRTPRNSPGLMLR